MIWARIRKVWHLRADNGKLLCNRHIDFPPGPRNMRPDTWMRCRKCNASAGKKLEERA
jgi:hypothetical protein